MKKTNHKETADRALTVPERWILLLTALVVALALAVELRPARELTMQPGVRAERAVRAVPETAVPERIDLNTADQAALETLPGIGPELARRILDYRAEHGPFQEPEQLLLVDGIGEKRFLGLSDLVTVSGEKEETP